MADTGGNGNNGVRGMNCTGGGPDGPAGSGAPPGLDDTRERGPAEGPGSASGQHTPASREGFSPFGRRSRRVEVAALVAAAAALVAFYTLVGCPIRLATGIPCPGCGMSRAVLSLAALDVAGAVYYHPLVFLLPLLGWALLGRGGPMARPRVRTVTLGILCAVFVAVWLVRMLVLHSPVLTVGLPGPVRFLLGVLGW